MLLPVVLLAAAGAAMLLFGDDEKPSEPCLDDNLTGAMKSFATWLLTAELGEVIEPNFGRTVNSSLLYEAAAEAEEGGHPKLAACLRARAAELEEQEEEEVEA